MPPPPNASVAQELREAIRRAVGSCVERNEIPGAVALVQWKGATLAREAFGFACVEPRRVAMRPGHKFDLASLTKVVATATALLALRDEGRLRLEDALGAHLPQLADSDKKDLTLWQLMTHTGGLPAFRRYYKKISGTEAYLRAIAAEPLEYAPGTNRIYSDIGFILLGWVVEAVAGAALSDFAQRAIFAPLGMDRTGFMPVAKGCEGSPDEFAATEFCPLRKRIVVGEVHDENAWALGGVSGHAGLFSTADDLARFGQMLLNKGEYGGARILSPESVALLNRPHVAGVDPHQGLAWRLRSSLESATGFLGSPRSFGHTGFTGTSLWIDPDNRVIAVLLTNAVHPDRDKAKREPVRLGFHRAVVETLKQAPANVRTGLDALEREGFERLKGRRVAVVTNHSAINREGVHLLDLLAARPEIQMAAIFSPEHGFTGEAAAGHKVGDSARGAVPVFSLYGQRRKPSPEMAELFDVMLYDIQDVGVRFYTYIWTMFSAQQFCAETGKRFIVLDRPNPLGGRIIEGPILDEAFATFVGLKPIPTRYGLTCGELAALFNQQGWLGGGLRADLEVVAMEGWRRDMRFHETGLPWIPPSPNMPTWDTAAIYPGACIFEGTNWSAGRGTAIPFEIVGGPGIDAERLADALNQQSLPGCHFLSVNFTPRSIPAAPAPQCQDQSCGGVFIRVDDHDAFRPVQTGVAILLALKAQAPGRHEWRASHFDRLLGTDTVRLQIAAGANLNEITARWENGLHEFERIRQSAVRYD